MPFSPTLAVWDVDDKGVRLTEPENPNLSGAIPCENEHHIAYLGYVRHKKV